tara:strand:- start:13797 stop:14471 length:675 start_codon:yes stop_codon:yes gene_type:complete
MKRVAIIQARMGSTRLPNKMLIDFNGYPIIKWVYHRVLKAKKIDQIIFAIPDKKEDDKLFSYLKSMDALVYRGSDYDVVERYYYAAKSFKASHVIRICGDNPLICGSEIDRLINFFDLNICDYAYNHIPKNNLYPDGLGAEICSIEVLKEIYLKSKSKLHREHVFNFIWDNANKYTIKTFDPPEPLSFPDVKLDIDTLQDLIYLSKKNFKIDMTAMEVINTMRK